MSAEPICVTNCNGVHDALFIFVDQHYVYCILLRLQVYNAYSSYIFLDFRVYAPGYVNDNLNNKRVSIIIQNMSFRAEIRPTFSDTNRLYVTPLNRLNIGLIIVYHALVRQKRMSVGK